ncbi:MAG: FtsX-like permease family protein [Anaerolineae bacterium]
MFAFEATLAARELSQRKLRTALTTLAITLGTLVIFGMNILLPTMLKAFQSSVMTASGQVDVTVTMKTDESFSRSVLNSVRRVDGVSAATGLLSRTTNIPDKFYGSAKVGALTVTGIEPTTAQALHNYDVVEGRFLHSDDPQSAVITRSLADTLGLGVGDKLRLPTTEGATTLKIVGLLPARTLPGNEQVLITLQQAQKLLDLTDRINTIEANLDTADSVRRQAILDQIAATVGKDFTLGGMSSGTELLSNIQVAQTAFNLFGFLALFMGAFIIFNSFRTIVSERRHDIGMLRAIGASRRTILGVILVEGLIQGIIGTALGIGLGYLMGAGIVAGYRPLMQSVVHMSIGQPVVSVWLFVVTIVLGVGATVFAGLLPAINATRVTPMDALRPATAETERRTSRVGFIVGVALVAASVAGLLSGNLSLVALGCLFFLFGLILVAPALVRPIASVFSALLALLFAREGTATLAQSNLSRQPTRAAITASATMIGLAIIVGMGGVVWSITGGFMDVLQRSLGSDYLLMPPSIGLWQSNVGAKGDLAQRIRGIPGVGVVSTLRYAMSSGDGQGVAVLGIDPVAYPQVASLSFLQGDNATAYAALADGRALIANGVFAAQSHVNAGDVVQLSTPTGVKPYTVIAIASDYLNSKISTAYISQANLQTDFRKTEDIFIQVNLAPGADAAQVEARLRDILKDYPQFSLVSGRGYIEQNQQLFNVVFGVMFVLLGVLVMPSLIALLNTLMIGVIERTREIGMLRAIGSTRRQVSRIVVVESLLLAAIGTALGLLAGLYLGYVMVLGMKVVGYPVSYSFPYAGLIAGAAIGLLFGVVAAMIPARQAARMDIIRALQYE